MFTNKKEMQKWLGTMAVTQCVMVKHPFLCTSFWPWQIRETVMVYPIES